MFNRWNNDNYDVYYAQSDNLLTSHTFMHEDVIDYYDSIQVDSLLVEKSYSHYYWSGEIGQKTFLEICLDNDSEITGKDDDTIYTKSKSTKPQTSASMKKTSIRGGFIREEKDSL